MARELWAKVHTEILGDPKLLTRPEGERFLWLALILLAKEKAPGDGILRGYTPALLTQILALRMKPVAVQAALDYFASVGMVTLGEGTIELVNFAKRQGVADAEARRDKWKDIKRRQREKSTLSTKDNGGHVHAVHLPSASCPPTEVEVEVEVEKEEKQKIPPLAADAAPGPVQASLPAVPSPAHPAPEAKKPKPEITPEQQACRRAITEAFSAQYHALSSGQDFRWGPAEHAGVIRWAHGCDDDPAKALPMLTEFVSRMSGNKYLAENFRPSFIAGQLNSLRLPVTATRLGSPPNGTSMSRVLTREELLANKARREFQERSGLDQPGGAP